MNWYCVHTKPRMEGRVARHMEKWLGLEVYYPRVKTKRVIRRVRREVVSPLFPGYLFCRFDMAKHFRAVRYGMHSLGLVNCGGLPVPVDDGIIAQLKDTAGDVMVSSLLEDRLYVGDRVKILEGPMQGMMGTVLKDLGEGTRVAILLSLLSCEARLVISCLQVSKANG